MSKIFYIMGKSSSGKDTIYKKIREKLPQLKRITPYTTRPIREGETDGQVLPKYDVKALQEFPGYSHNVVHSRKTTGDVRRPERLPLR